MLVKINEMSLGYRGNTSKEAINRINRLTGMFKTFEWFGLPLQKKYDVYYIDISAQGYRLISFIRDSYVMPMIVRFEYAGYGGTSAQELLNFLHPDSYLVLNDPGAYSGPELFKMVEEYLKRFEEKKSEYQSFKDGAHVRMNQIQLSGESSCRQSEFGTAVAEYEET